MISLFLCGDVVNYTCEDHEFVSSELMRIITDADYSICNFEAPIHNAYTPVQKSGIHHSQLEVTVEKLRKYGFDLLTLANNHAMDFGYSGLEKTISKIEEHGLDHIGAGPNFESAYQPLVKEFGNLKVALISAAELQYGALDYSKNQDESGYAWINHPHIDKTILELRDTCDFIIFLAHAGLEHFSTPQLEWRKRYQHFCDLGVDIVVASHPHVPQGYESYNGSYIFYSLGNFYFDSEKYRNRQNKNYSINIKLEKHHKPIIDIIYHYNNDGIVDLSNSPETKLNLNELNTLIRQNFIENNNKMATEVYETIIKKNLLHSLSAISLEDNIWTNIKKSIKYFLRKDKINKLELKAHLIRNESYYFAIQRAFKVELQKCRDSYE